MTVTFIAHSAFLVEWDKFYTLFDYTYEPDYTGALPELSGDKPLLVFSSHSHEDHFDAKVFTLLEKYPGARFFVSRDTRLTERKRQWLNISDAAFARTTVLRPDSILLTDVAGEDLSIHAIKSTDIGNAYLLRCEGKMVYHGGDLNWWDWKSEGEAYCNNMAARRSKSSPRRLKTRRRTTPSRPRSQRQWHRSTRDSARGARGLASKS